MIGFGNFLLNEYVTVMNSTMVAMENLGFVSYVHGINLFMREKRNAKDILLFQGR